VTSPKLLLSEQFITSFHNLVVVVGHVVSREKESPDPFVLAAQEKCAVAQPIEILATVARS
jgi:hypothetical protein